MSTSSRIGSVGSGNDNQRRGRIGRRGRRTTVRASGAAAASAIERLEGRTLLSNTFTVTNLNDSGAGSLRQAITSANGATVAGPDPIVTWNAIAAQAAADGNLGFTELRDDPMVHLAQFDALDSIEQR